MVKAEVWMLVTVFLVDLHAVTSSIDVPGDISQNKEQSVQLLKEMLERLPISSLRNQEDILEHKLKLFNLTRDISSKLTATLTDSGEDIVLRRQLVNIKNSILLLNDTDMNKFENISNTIFTVHRQNIICMYEDKENCSLAYVPHIQDILRTSDDPEALTYYWKSWNENYSGDIKHLFGEWLSIVRSSLNSEGESSEPFSVDKLRYQQYEKEDILEHLETNINKLQPFYKKVHAYIRTMMRFSFSYKFTKPAQPLPAQFLPYVQRKLDLQNAFTNEVNDAFENFDMLNLDIQHLRTFFPDFDENDVHSLIEANHLRKEYCLKEYGTTEKRAQYARFYKNLFLKQNEKILAELPIGLNQEACPGFEDAVFKAIQLSISSPQHLKRAGIINHYEYSDGMRFYHLMESAVSTLFKLMIHFVNERFIIKSLDKNVETGDYTCNYWKLMNEFAGLQPDYTIANTSFPLPFFMHGCLWDTQFSIKQVFSEIVGFQIYQALCRKFDAAHPLQDCDILQNADAGRLIKKAMQQGATVSWKRALNILAEDEEISVIPLLNYYQPLLNSLEAKKKETNFLLGWSRDTVKC